MKNFSLVIIISAITALGGYLLGKSSPAQTQITATETNTLQDNSIKSSIYQMTKADMEEYSKLKNQKEKYNKANDILQKILKIFLLDLGLRISDSNYDLLKQSFDEPSSPPVDSTVIAKLDSNSSDSEILAAVKKNLKEQVGSTDWVNKENKASEVASDEDAKSFLKSVEIKDFFKSLKSLKPINKTQANVITGSFWGKANVYVKNQNVVWDVEMDIIDTSQDGQLTADTKIKMFQDGKRFSKSTGDGKYKNFRSLSGSKLAIIVDTYGGDGFFQLYEVERMNALIGNYYHKQSIGEFKKVGTVYLERR